MPRPALTEAQRRATRRKIRQAAAQLHAENGLADISARAVAEKAGVSVGTLYSYFGSLSELMQSLWRQPASRLVDQLQLLARQHEKPADCLRALLQAYVDFAVQERAVFNGAFLFVRPQSQQAPPQVRLEDDRFFSIFRQAIVEGQEVGAFQPGEPDHLVQLVLSAVHGSLALPVNMHRLALDASGRLPRKMIDMVMDWLLDYDVRP